MGISLGAVAILEVKVPTELAGEKDFPLVWETSSGDGTEVMRVTAAELHRIAVLHSCRILDTPAEDLYDEICRLAQHVCQVPIVLISLVDGHRQWFKSKIGIAATQTPRDVSFCSYAIESSELLVVPNATRDARFARNSLVTGEPHIRFYAGAPLRLADGYHIGTLCIIDTMPREITDAQRECLRVLARQISFHLQARRQQNDLERARSDAQTTLERLRASEERFRAFMDHSPAMAFIKDAAGRFIYVNEPLAKRFDRPVSKWLGKTDVELWNNEHAETLRRTDLEVLSTRTPIDLLERLPTPDGASEFWSARKFCITDDLNQSFLAGIAVDVTEQIRSAERLKSTEARYLELFDQMTELVYTLDAGGRFVFTNHAWQTVLGDTREQCRTLTMSERVYPPDAELFQAAYERVLAHQTRETLETRFVARSGELVFVKGTISYCGDAEHPRQTRGIFHDMTAHKLADSRLIRYQQELVTVNEKLRTMVATDALTGLKNRMALNDRLQEEFDRAVRHKRPLSLLMIDVDHFKHFNDTFGHQAGDDALIAVSNLLAESARGVDFVARYGGEEFVVLLPDTDISGAMVLAERFRRAVATAIWDYREITISLGAATWSHVTRDAQELLREADSALYQSKAIGRNRVSHGSTIVTTTSTQRTTDS